MDFGNMYRDIFSRKLLKAIKDLESKGSLPPHIFKTNKILTIGGAFCNDVELLSRKYIPSAQIISIDPVFAYFEGFKNIRHIENKVQNIKPEDIDGCMDLVEMGHVLQECETDEKKMEILRSVRTLMRERGYLILTEEVRRPGWKGLYDRSLHYLYNKGIGDLISHLLNQNLNDGYYIKGSMADYRRIIECTGFRMVTEPTLYFRGTFIVILEAVN